MTELVHHCHFPGCEVPTPRKYLYCTDHWLLVPHLIRQKVLRAYNALPHGDEGQILLTAWNDDYRCYMAAVKEAEEAVKAKLAAQEGT